MRKAHSDSAGSPPPQLLQGKTQELQMGNLGHEKRGRGSTIWKGEWGRGGQPGAFGLSCWARLWLIHSEHLHGTPGQAPRGGRQPIVSWDPSEGDGG